MYSDPIAYFITWTTYATWLPGDERGWQEYQGGFHEPDPKRADEASFLLTEEPCTLTEQERDIVEKQIAETCAHRGWKLHAVKCRTNHVHVVVTAPNDAGDKVRDDLKAWSTRRLKEKSDPGRIKWRTERGSIRKIFDDQGLCDAVEYVLEVQDRKGRDE